MFKKGGYVAAPAEPTVPRLSASGLPGVIRATLPLVRYNDSILVEAHRDGWEGLFSEPLRHLYWIVTSRGVERNWGRHDVTTDHYAAISGVLEVALIDGRRGSPSENQQLVVTLDGSTGDGLIIPPGVWHTFRSVSETGILLNSKSPPYDPGHPDKHVVPLADERFGFSWPD